MSMDFQRQLPGSKNSAESHWLYKVHLDPLLLVLVVAPLFAPGLRPGLRLRHSSRSPQGAWPWPG